MIRYLTLALSLTTALLTGSVCAAAKEGASEPPAAAEAKKAEREARRERCTAIREEMKAFRKELAALVKERRTANREANKEMMKSLKGQEDTGTILSTLRQRADAMLAQMDATRSEVQDKCESFMNDLAAKYEIPEEKLAKRRESLAQRSADHEAQMSQRRAAVDEFFSVLGAEKDLTPREIASAVRGFMKDQRAKNKAHRQEMRESREQQREELRKQRQEAREAKKA